MSSANAASTVAMITLADFDKSLLDREFNDLSSREYRDAVREHFLCDYGRGSYFVDVSVDEDTIHVARLAEPEAEFSEALRLLRQRRVIEATPLLEKLYTEFPQHLDIRYNLGMLYSDQGKLAEAVALLDVVTQRRPEQAHAWIALSVAYQRAQQLDKALDAARAGIEADDQDAFVLRTYGALLGQSANIAEALPVLERAATLAPDDPYTLAAYAQTLVRRAKDSDLAVADELYKRVMELAPGTSLADQAVNARNSFASKNYRKDDNQLQPEAVAYCLSTLKRIRGFSKQELASFGMELSTLGESGLDVNNPESRYTLSSVPGEFSGLEILSMLYVVVQKLAPGQDVGFDLSAEYAAACKLFVEQEI